MQFSESNSQAPQCFKITSQSLSSHIDSPLRTMSWYKFKLSILHCPMQQWWDMSYVILNSLLDAIIFIPLSYRTLPSPKKKKTNKRKRKEKNWKKVQSLHTPWPPNCQEMIAIIYTTARCYSDKFLTLILWFPPLIECIMCIQGHTSI